MPAVSDAVPSPAAREATWVDFHHRWRRLQPPLRPHADVCASIARSIAGRDSRVLVLGVTPELADAGVQTIAVDWSASAVAHIWPGNARARLAWLGNWLQLPASGGAFSAAVGDGSLSCLRFPDGYRQAFSELSRVVRPGGRIVVRLYAAPAVGETLSAVRMAVLRGEVGTIHALKWRIAHAVCVLQRDPNVPVRQILDAFDVLFPDRRALMAVTGWSAEDVSQVDAYGHMPDVFSFPTVDQVRSVVPRQLESRLIQPCGSYELAERCPLLVMDVAGSRR